MAAATQSVPALEGNGPALVALPGFLIWLVFVVGYSIGMIRSPGQATT